MANSNFRVELGKLKSAKNELSDCLGHTKKSSCLMNAVDRSGIEGGQFDGCYTAIEALKARLKEHCVEIAALQIGLQRIIDIYDNEEMDLVNSSDSHQGYISLSPSNPFPGWGRDSEVKVDGGVIMLDYEDIRIVGDSLNIDFDL